MPNKNMGREGLLWFTGEVEDIDDPKKLGRVRVRMVGTHSNTQIQTSDLPWATPIMPFFSAALKGIGVSPTGIDKGSKVFGYCLDGYEQQIPLIWGTYNKMTSNTNDVSDLARGTNSIDKQQDGPEPPSAYGAKYPNNKVLTTKAGHAVEVDDTPGAERIHIFHKSGSYTEINFEGRMVTKTMDDHIEVDMKDRTIWVSGDYTANVQGDYTIDVAGDLSVNVGGSITFESGDETSMKSGDTFDAEAATTLTIKDADGSFSPPDDD